MQGGYTLDVERSIIDNMDYLKLLVKEIDKKDISSIDSNLLYEVAYASTYLDLIIELSNKNKDLNKNLKDIKLVLDNVLSTASKERLEKVKEGLDYKKLLKARYDNISDACYYKTDEITILNKYIVKILKDFALSVSFSAFLLSGMPFKILSLIAKDPLTGVLFDTLFGLFRSLIGFLGVGLAVYILARVIIDTIIIAFPSLMSVTDLGYKSAFSRALKGTNSESCMDDLVTYSTKKSFDRVNRNKAWLNTMISALRSEDSLTSESLSILENLESTRDLIVSLDNKGIRNKSYYINLARVEFLRDRYLGNDRMMK